MTAPKRGSAARRGGALLAAAFAALATAASPVDAAQTTPLVTHDDAMHVLRRFERVNARNNSSLAVEGQGAVESPPVQLIDDATFREVRNRGGSLGEQGRFTRRRVFVPRQTEYPLQFLASVRIDDGSRQLLVFTRPSEPAPWKVALAAGIVEEPVPELATDTSGYAALLDADHTATLAVPPDGIAAALADLWARSATDQPPASSDFFASGPLTNEAVGAFVGDLAASGIEGDVQFGFEPASFPVVAYDATRGRALVLFAITVRETIRPPRGAAALVQPKSRRVFGGLVVPGRYASVAYERLEILAAVVPPTGAGRVRVIGDYGGTVRAQTTPEGAAGSTA